MKRKIRVYYTVGYYAEVEFDDDDTEFASFEEEAREVAGDIDIPEGGEHNSIYKSNSFEVRKIVDLTPPHPLEQLAECSAGRSTPDEYEEDLYGLGLRRKIVWREATQ